MLAGYWNYFPKFVQMGDFQFWLYVIIGIIYLVSRLLKKSQAEESEGPTGRQPQRRQASESIDTDQRGEERPLTFEELLREITEGKSRREPPPSVPQPRREPDRPVYQNYDDEVEDEEDEKTEVLEDVNYDYRTRDSLYQQYEDAKREAFERKSLEETLTLASTDMGYGKFKEFEKQEDHSIAKEYLADLHDPEGLKKAFVLSEILQRKF